MPVRKATQPRAVLSCRLSHTSKQVKGASDSLATNSKMEQSVPHYGIGNASSPELTWKLIIGTFEAHSATMNREATTTKHASVRSSFCNEHCKQQVSSDQSAKMSGKKVHARGVIKMERRLCELRTRSTRGVFTVQD